MNRGNNIEFQDVNSQNWKQFQQFTNRILKAKYPDSLFTDFDSHGHLMYIAKIATANGIIIAGMKAYSIVSSNTSRILPTATYIETLVVDETYQGKGLGTMMLRMIEQESEQCFIQMLLLHTPVNNTKTIQWYLSRSFQIQDTILGHYDATDLDSSHSSDAYLLQKNI